MQDFTGIGYENETQSMIDVIDSYIDETPTYTGITHRGMAFDDSEYETFIKGIYEFNILFCF